MSVYFCFFHRSRVKGRLDAAYPTVLRGGARFHSKLRLCSDHLGELLGSRPLSVCTDGDSDGVSAYDLCAACGQEAPAKETLDVLFFTYYRRGEDRRDLFGVLCRACGDLVIDQWGLSL